MLVRARKVFAIVCLLSVLKHFTLLPNIDWKEHEITGFEVKFKWWF